MLENLVIITKSTQHSVVQWPSLAPERLTVSNIWQVELMSCAACPSCKGSWDHQHLEFSASQRKVGFISTSGENPLRQEEGAKWTRLTNTHYTHVLMDAKVMLLLVWCIFLLHGVGTSFFIFVLVFWVSSCILSIFFTDLFISYWYIVICIFWIIIWMLPE